MMAPVKIGTATLYHGDCREILPTLAGIEAIVTDPPYGIGYVHSGGGRALALSSCRNIRPIAGDDQPFDSSRLLTFPEVLLWGAVHHPISYAGGRWLVWNKLGGRANGWDSFADAEIAWCSNKGCARVFSHLYKGCLRAGEESGKRRWHPAQKPVALMTWCLGFIKGRTICDPYMGTGTTGIACARDGRRFIGIELDREYFEIACERLAAEQLGHEVAA